MSIFFFRVFFSRARGASEKKERGETFPIPRVSPSFSSCSFPTSLTCFWILGGDTESSKVSGTQACLLFPNVLGLLPTESHWSPTQRNCPSWEALVFLVQVLTCVTQACCASSVP